MMRNRSEPMPPGRDMDALLAIHVFGYHREVVPPDVDGANGGTEVLVPPGKTLVDFEPLLPRRGAVALPFFTKRWSTRHEQALQLVDRLNALGFNVVISRGPGFRTWDVRGWKDDNTQRFIAHAEDFAHALSLAALDACMPGLVDG